MRPDGVIHIEEEHDECAIDATEIANEIVNTLSYKTSPNRFAYQCHSFNGQLELELFDRTHEQHSIYIRGFSWYEIWLALTAARNMMRLCIG
jgi:glutamine amidotransferase PdxT